MINIRSHISNKEIKKQFKELDSLNLKERFYYGIVSNTIPNKQDSPLAVTISKNTFYLYPGMPKISGGDVIPSDADYITVVYEKDDGSLEKELIYQSPTTWQYKDTPFETATVISNYLNRVYINYLYSYVENDSVVATTINGKTYINVYSPSERMSIHFISSLQINKGTVVFPSGVNLSLDKDTLFNFNIEDAKEGDEYRILLKYKLVPFSYGENLFGESEVKSYTFDSLENCIVFSKVRKDNLEKDEVCIGIIKIVRGTLNIVDNNGHLYAYNRPWFSPKDIEHRANLGSSKVTKNNPHGIGYNDIDPDNTLHNRLLDNGIIISKPNAIQDCSGVLVEETLKASNVIIDDNNTFKISRNSDKPYYPMYHKLSYYPNQILGIYNDSGKEVCYRHIKGTCYLLVEDVLEDITVKYLATKTAFSNIDYSQGIVLNSLDKNDLLLSEGKNVTLFNIITNLFHKNINGYYVVGIDKNGNLISNPEIKINNNLDIDSDYIKDVSSISRVKIYLYNTDAKFDLVCPSSGVDFEATDEYNISKTNASYLINATNSYSLFRESYISPVYNNYIEISEESEETIPEHSNNFVKDYIKISTNESDGNNVNIKSLNLQNYGYLTDSIRRQITLNIDGENKNLLVIKGIIKIKNCRVTPSVHIYSNNTSLCYFSGENKEVTYIVVDWKNTSDLILTNLITLKFPSELQDAYIVDIKLDLIYDFVINRYFITQKENEEQVTRLLYDPTLTYGDSIIKVGNDIYIKKEDIIYDEENPLKITSSTNAVVAYLNKYKGDEVTFNFNVIQSSEAIELFDESKGIRIEITSENTEYAISNDYEGLSILIPSFSEISGIHSVTIEVVRKIDDNKFIKKSDLKTNFDFSVEVSIYGESNGESITETVSFDSDFREQEPFNYKLTENAFESISKYTINSKNTNGNILILTFPISNYSNPCNISNMQFKQNSITKYTDSRICVSKIDDSLISREDVYDMMNTSDVIDAVLEVV